jgi:ABC transporter substrate binding protein (PQQ-dependent alcohol dehydrogenase system)
MKKDAETQWQKKNPNSSAKAQAWHHSFKKYAAGQLNTRFTRSSHHKMTDTAWAGWASVKLLSDSVARNQFNDTTSLLKFIKTELAFDGQKGMSLNFRDTGQLRQPLLLIDNGKIAGEAPVRGVVNTTNLDSLGLTHCPK